MPRIDPTRLLLCLKSLLNLQTGGIKSDKDVDKVFVLMTKFSKKLVSKCTYINILKATAPDVLNVFMDRGGWEMLHNWTVEAKNAKNHDLLNEILTLLIVTPASVDRLRANSLPKEVKQISNKWDVANTKSLAEKLVSKWITIARNEDSRSQQQQQVGQVPQPSSIHLNTNIASAGFVMQNMVQLAVADDSGLINSNNLNDNSVFASEGQPNTIDMDVDYDINNVDLNEMMDFNPDLFTKTIDQHLGELNSAETDRNHTMQLLQTASSNNAIGSNLMDTNTNVSVASDSLQQQSPFIIQANNTSPSVIHSIATTTATPTMPVVSSSPAIPRIVIKTSGGQRSVVIQQQGNPAQVSTAQPVDNVNKERVCFVTHNGQRFLMQLQVADNDTVDKLNMLSVVAGSGGGVMAPPTTIFHQQPPPLAVPQLTQDQQVTSSVTSMSPEVAYSATPSPVLPEPMKRKRPRKDPTITAMKNQTAAAATAAAATAAAAAAAANNVNKPEGLAVAGTPKKVLKSYSKKPKAIVLIDPQPATTTTSTIPETVPAVVATPSPDTTKGVVPVVGATTASKSKAKPSAATTVITGNTSVISKSTKSPNSSTSSASSGTSSSKQSSATKRSSKQSSAAAAAAAAEAEKAEKLKQKTKEAKRKMKERNKKSEDDKQKQKNDQTLKEIYGTSASTTATVKIPKKPKPSFTDLIGVPGAKEEPKKEKITKEKNDKTGKGSKDSDKDPDGSSSEKDVKDDELADMTGLGEFSRPETKEIGPAKERRHQVKVYVSAKSKNMDLLETMTKGAKIKPKLTDSDAKAEKSSNSGSFEDAISGASTSSSGRATTKRPSIDSATKTGDAKKLKFDEALSSSDKIKDSKDKSSKDKKGKDEKNNKGKDSAPSTVKKAQVIQESSLFMDTLNATREPAKNKRRRRISSSTDPIKDKDNSSTNHTLGSTSASLSGEKESPTQELPSSNANIIKPMINFYRDTLNDSDDDGANAAISDYNKVDATSDLMGSVSAVSAAAPTISDIDSGKLDENVTDIVDDFAPEEWEGKLKSCLCIHRPKGRSKKLVRWREDEELKEYHFFEMDETERVNVTKQIKNFSEMKLMERSEEKFSNANNWKQKEFGNQPEERFSWVKPRPIIFPEGTIHHEANSKEEQIQDERERSILQVFYFPGSNLPDHPSEVDVVNMEIDSNNIPTMISADDVPVLTKLYDYRNKPWPRPVVGIISPPKNKNNNVATVQPSIVQNTIPVQTPIIDPNLAFPNAYNQAAQQIGVGVGSMDTFNPWVQTFNQVTAQTQQVTDPWKVAQEVAGFPGFQTAGNVPQVNAFQPLQAFGFPSFATPPPVVGNMAISQMQQQPHLSQPQPVPPPTNFGAFGMSQQFDPTLNTIGREDSGPPRHHTQQQGQSQGVRGSRDVDYREMRRNDRHNDRDDRDTRNRDRDHHRPGRGDNRSRDRDFRDRGRDRAERYDNDRDYRSHDRDRGSYKRPSGGRRQQTLCNYFAKGFCREGDKCTFLHPGVNGPPKENSNSSSANNNVNNSRRPPSSPPSSSSGTHYENTRRRSPPLANKELPTNYQNSPPNTSNTSSIDSNSNSHSSNRSREIPEIESPTPDAERFDMPPSSPSENHNFPPRADTVKVIPTFTEEDWG